MGSELKFASIIKQTFRSNLQNTGKFSKLLKEFSLSSFSIRAFYELSITTYPS